MEFALLLAKLRDFFKSPAGRIVGMVLLFVLYSWALSGWSHHSGVMEERHRWEARAKAVGEKASTAAASFRSADTASKLANQVRISQLTKEVPRYVTSKGNAKCVVPAGFVSLLNDAIGVPATPGGPVEAGAGTPPAENLDPDAPSGLQLSDVAENDLYNIGVGQDLRIEVLSWRGWYAKMATLYGEAHPRP